MSDCGERARQDRKETNISFFAFMPAAAFEIKACLDKAVDQDENVIAL